MVSKRRPTVLLGVLLATIVHTIAPGRVSCAAEAAGLDWSVDAATGAIEATRAPSAVRWNGGRLATIMYWDADRKVRSSDVAPSDDWTIRREPIDRGCRLDCRHEKLGLAFRVSLTSQGDVLSVAVPAGGIEETGAARLKRLYLLPHFGAAVEGDEGYLVIPQQSGALCYFRDKKPAEVGLSVYQSTCQCTMPIFGLVHGDAGMAAIVTSGQYDARFRVSTNWGPKRQYAIDPIFMFRSFAAEDRLADDIAVEYHFLTAPGMDWTSVGKCYRQHNVARRGIRPLARRAGESPELDYSAQALQVRIRLGVKPVPYEITEQTPKTEPPLRVFCTFAEVRDIFDEFHRQGIRHAEFCLVGWNRGGHDGRYPQIFPVEPALGGEAELRATIRHGQSLGYQVVAHDCYYGAYHISEDWSEDYLRKNPDGKPQKGGVWGGGQSYNICLDCADRLFAQRDLPRIRELGFRGLHYSDVLTITGPRPCYDPKHPQTRRQDAEAAGRILARAQKLFGGAQSEGALDFAAASFDRVLYVDCDKWSPLAKKPYVDACVPLYEVVYHGVLLYNLSTNTVNCLPGEDGYLKSIEYGAAPLAYFYGHFLLNQEQNWLGPRDYVYQSPEQLRGDVAGLRRVYNDLRRLAYLQKESLDGHRPLANGVFETTYGNGHRVVVNYNQEPYDVPSGQSVPPRDFVLIEP